jgi:hypothetical protein
MSIRDDDNLDDYHGAEGDVVAEGIGLHWLKADRVTRLRDRLSELYTESARTWVAVLDYLAKESSAEHVELAHRVGCTPEQLRTRNGKMTQLIREEFTGYGWPIGWHYGRAEAGEVDGATIYEMHPQVACRWMATATDR